MRSPLRLLTPLLLLALSLGLAYLGVQIWEYRHVPVGITDPTSFKVNTVISSAIIFPSLLGALFAVIALIQRLLPPPRQNRS